MLAVILGDGNQITLTDTIRSKSMSERVSISLTVNEGDVLKGFSWASNGNAKGNVVIFEGMEEHVSR